MYTGNYNYYPLLRLSHTQCFLSGVSVLRMYILSLTSSLYSYKVVTLDITDRTSRYLSRTASILSIAKLYDLNYTYNWIGVCITSRILHLPLQCYLYDD